MSTLHRTEWRAVGTTCSAAVTAAPRRRAPRRAWRSAPRRTEVAACERELSRFDPASDLSRLNAAAGAWTPVGRRLLEALRLALRAREDTGGRFDPTVLPALVAAGYDRSFEQLEERPADAGRRLARRRGDRARRSTAAARGSSRAPPSTSAGSARATRPTRARRDARDVARPPGRPRRPRRRHRRLRRAARRTALADRRRRSAQAGRHARRARARAGGVATSGRDAAALRARRARSTT